MNRIIINCTPHTVTVLDEDGKTIASYDPSGTVPRIGEVIGASWPVIDPDSNEVPTEDVWYSDTQTSLPEGDDETIYIVSRIFAFAFPDRADLCFPSREVRDSSGRIIGCRALGWAAR